MRRRLGQHFLFDPTILKRIVDASNVSSDDLVVEIGPGKGRLTEILAKRVGKVIAIELDERFCDELERGVLRHLQNVELHCMDVLRFPFEELPPFRVVANIPYYITTPIIFRLLQDKVQLISATLTIQKEVAERIIATPGGKQYGVLSLMVQYFTEPSILFYIPRGAFSPPPKVDSAVIHLKRRAQPPVEVVDRRLFFRLIKDAFSKRRKTISNSLKGYTRNIKEALKRADIDVQIRPERLGMDDFARLSNIVAELIKADRRNN